MNSTLSNNFDFSNPSCYPRILQLKVVQEIVHRLQNLDINQENANKFVSSGRCLFDFLDLSTEGCLIFKNDVKYISCKVRLISLDMFIKITNLSVQSYNSDTRDLFYIFCFTDTGSFPNQEYISEENFYCDGESFPDDKIYKLFNNISMDALGAFFRNKNFIKKLGGVQRLTNFLRMKLIMYQLSKLIRSIFVFLFGIGLLFASGFAWSLLFLLSLGFLISGITTFTNSILYMKPSRFRARLAKCFKYCAWIINGALLITLGVTFCVGVLEIALITLGSLEILRGLFNEFVRVGFAVMCMTGILLALNPAILPIALPFLPTIGIGIAVLSGLGFVKSALSLFYNGMVAAGSLHFIML